MTNQYEIHSYSHQEFEAAGKGLSDLLGELYCSIFNGYTPGEEHNSLEVQGRLKNDLLTGQFAKLITLEESGRPEGFLWAWMGLSKQEFIANVADHATLATSSSEEAEQIHNQVIEKLNSMEDVDWEHVAYVPEVGIAKEHRKRGNFFRLVGVLANEMVEQGCTQFLFWTLQNGENAIMRIIMEKIIGGKAIAQLPDNRVLMWGDSQKTYQFFGGDKTHATAD